MLAQSIPVLGTRKLRGRCSLNVGMVVSGLGGWLMIRRLRMFQTKIRMAAIRPASAIQAKRSLEVMGGSGLSGEMHGENLPV